METPPGMVSRFWAPMARIGTGQKTSGDDMVLPGEKRREEERRAEGMSPLLCDRWQMAPPMSRYKRQRIRQNIISREDMIVDGYVVFVAQEGTQHG